MAKHLLGAFLLLGFVVGYGDCGTETTDRSGKISQPAHLIVTSSAMRVFNSHRGSKDYNYRNENAESVWPVVIPIHDFTNCVSYDRQVQKCDGNCADDNGVSRCNSDVTHFTASCNAFATNTASSTYSLSGCGSFAKLDLTNSASASRTTVTQNMAHIQSRLPSSTSSSIASLTEPSLQLIHTPYVFVIVQTLTLTQSETGTSTKLRNFKAGYSGAHSASTSKGNATSNRRIKESEYHAMQIRREIVVGCLIGAIMALIAGGLGAVLCWGWVRGRRRRRLLEMEEAKAVDG